MQERKSEVDENLNSYNLRLNSLIDKLQKNYQIKASKFIRHDSGNLTNIIEGYGSQIDEDTEENSKKRSKIKSAEKRLDSLLEKGEEILDSTEKSLDIGEQLEEAREMLEPLMERNGTNVEIQAEGKYLVKTMPLVERIFYDMMDNASEHGRADTTVEVYGEQDYVGVKFDQELDAESIYTPGEGLNGSNLVAETAKGLNIDIVNLEGGYELRIPRDLHEDNQA